MTFLNNTKIILTTLLCKFDNFLINHYFDLNYSNNYNNECNISFYNDFNNEFENHFNKINVNNFNNVNNVNNVNITTLYNILNNTININFLDNLNILDYKSLLSYKENFYYYYPNYYNLLLSTIIIIFGDFLLMFLFTSKGRWFQLHAFTNLLIVINILPEIKNIIIFDNYDTNNIKNNIPSFYILILHIYHILTFKNLSAIDYFHHIVFVGLGVIPTILFLKTNQCFLAYITGMGIPGFIEYTSLTLYKNNYINLLTQKKIISFIYNYFRYPLCIFGITLNLINYKNGYLIDNFFLTIYLNSLLFFNGSLFNYLTLNSYFKYKYEIKTNIDINYSKKNQ